MNNKGYHLKRRMSDCRSTPCPTAIGKGPLSCAKQRLTRRPPYRFASLKIFGFHVRAACALGDDERQVDARAFRLCDSGIVLLIAQTRLVHLHPRAGLSR